MNKKMMDDFDDNDCYISLDMLMLLYTRSMIIQRVTYSQVMSERKALLQLFNPISSPSFYVKTMVSCDLNSVANEDKECEFDYETKGLIIIE